MSMREINIIVPPHKSDDVVKCLKEDCGIATIHRVKGESTHTVTVYATVSASGPILHYLDMIGVGVVYGRIAMLPTHLLKPLPRINLAQSTAATKDGALPTTLKREVKGEHARMAVEEIWASVSGGCDLTADYIGLIMVASAIAGLGLATNNTVMIVASMLLSPLMSPILGFTLGTVMRDWVMFRIAVKAELAGLVTTLLVGLAVGCIFAPWSGEFAWPTAEMEGRGQTTGLLVGLAFAVPSGAGVALSASGSGGSNSLVGVAIAASLLPPVVNTGMCISFAFLGPALYGADEFSRNEFLTIAYISFCLFLLNVAVIFLIAVGIFKLKGIKGIRRKSSMYNTLPTVMTEEERERAYASARDRASASDSVGSVGSARKIPAGSPAGNNRRMMGARRGGPTAVAIAHKASAQEKLSKLKAAAQSMIDTSSEAKQEISAALAAAESDGGSPPTTATAVVTVVSNDPVAPGAVTVETPLT